MGIILIFYQWCYLAAVERIGVVAATLIALCVPPALVALLSALFLGETLSRTALIALGERSPARSCSSDRRRS